ncbi:hypothetical protein OEG92_08570 [Polaribacter sejongensis]|uniref:hypothetical protein n=1 Tax=Polaribacter sejongensis TaxID=985043 RepID=UPI0035A5803D
METSFPLSALPITRFTTDFIELTTGIALVNSSVKGDFIILSIKSRNLDFFTPLIFRFPFMISFSKISAISSDKEKPKSEFSGLFKLEI